MARSRSKSTRSSSREASLSAGANAGTTTEQITTRRTRKCMLDHRVRIWTVQESRWPGSSVKLIRITSFPFRFPCSVAPVEIAAIRGSSLRAAGIGAGRAARICRSRFLVQHDRDSPRQTEVLHRPSIFAVHMFPQIPNDDEWFEDGYGFPQPNWTLFEDWILSEVPAEASST